MGAQIEAGDADALDEEERAPDRFRRTVIACSFIATAGTTIGTALSPYLLVEAPLLLLALSAEARHVVLVAASSPLLPVFVIAFARRIFSLSAAFGLGIHFGDRVVSWTQDRYPRLGRFVQWAQRLLAKVGPLMFILFPNHSLAALAGVARFRRAPFFIALVIGQCIWVPATYYFGAYFADWSTLLIDWLRAHLWESTLTCIAAVLLQQLIARRGKNTPDVVSGV